MPDYPPGSPAWVELGSPNPDESAEFYGSLFGWQAQEAGDPEETGGYRLFTLDGKQAAGLMALQQEGQPPNWLTYIYVSGADETAGKIKDNGGQVFMEPFDVMDLGRMGVAADPTGAAFGFWEPRKHTGAEVFNEQNALCWNELQTRDAEKAKDFYKAVFDWDIEEMDMGGGASYGIAKVGERQAAGMIEMNEEWPDKVPSNWLAYFLVDDVDARADQAKAAGAQVAYGPRDIQGMGRFVVLADPHGATFALWKQAGDRSGSNGGGAEG